VTLIFVVVVKVGTTAVTDFFPTTILLSLLVLKTRKCDSFCSCAQDGAVREHGTHSELLSMKGHYYRLVQAQKSCAYDSG
jgi:ABC-type transport system involved in cytochrome bd biosynthesis fused ATPase/permease subunit